MILDMRARNERERLEAHIQHKPFNFVSGPPGSSVGSNSPGSVTLSRPRGINGQGRQATPPVSINLQTAEDSAGSSTNPPAAARGRQAGGASDFVKKLHKCVNFPRNSASPDRDLDVLITRLLTTQNARRGCLQEYCGLGSERRLVCGESEEQPGAIVVGSADCSGLMQSTSRT